MAAESPTRLRRLGAAVRAGATHNLPLKALALVMAFGLWAFVNFGERDTEEAIKVPVELRNIPARLMITSPRVDFIDVRVVGPRTLLGRIDYGRLAIPLDFSGARSGPAIFTVNVDRLDLPRGVRVVRVTPAQITVTLERVRRKTVPVQLRLDGEPPPDFRIVASTLTPDVVELSGPDSQIARIEAVATDPLLLDASSQAPIRQELPIEPLGEYVTARPGSVRAEVEIEEVRIERELPEVPVDIVTDQDGDLVLAPATVRVALRGPRRVLEPVEAAGLARIDATGLAPGEHRVAVEVAVPEEAELVEVTPAEVGLTIAVELPPADAEAAPEAAELRPPPAARAKERP